MLWAEVGEGAVELGGVRLLGKPFLGVSCEEVQDFRGPAQGKKSPARFLEAALGGGRPAGRRFRSPGSQPSRSWLLAGAITLAAAGDLDAWHSRAGCSAPRLLHPAAPKPWPRAAEGVGGHRGDTEGTEAHSCPAMVSAVLLALLP